MDEKALFWVSLACTIVGIVSVFLISETVASGKVGIDEISSEDVGKKIMITGMLVDVKEKPSLFLLELEEDNRSINAVWFKGGGSFLNKAEYNVSDFVLGSEIEVAGNLQEWYGQLEIVAEELSFK